jgi:hypothetical protein
MAARGKRALRTVRAVPVIQALLICLFVGGAAIGYVYQKNQLNRLNRAIEDLRDRRDRLVSQGEEYRRKVSELHAPDRIRAEVERLGLVLIEPDPRDLEFIEVGPEGDSDPSVTRATTGAGALAQRSP